MFDIHNIAFWLGLVASIIAIIGAIIAAVRFLFKKKQTSPPASLTTSSLPTTPLPNPVLQPFAAPPPYPLPQHAYSTYPGQRSVQPRSSSMTPALIAMLVILAIAFIGLGVYFLTIPRTGATNVAGTWSITTIATGNSASFSMSLEQNGNSVTGDLNPGGTQPSETISGSILGNNITFTLAEASDSVQFTGTVTDATDMSGYFTVTYQNGSPSVSGSWSATKS